MFNKLINLFRHRLTPAELEEATANIRCAKLCESVLVRMRQNATTMESTVIDHWLDQIAVNRHYFVKQLKNCKL